MIHEMQNAAAMSPRPVSVAEERLLNAVNVLHGTTTNLMERLYGVMDDPRPTVAETVKQPELQSDKLADRVVRLALDVEAATARLSDILDRLQL